MIQVHGLCKGYPEAGQWRRVLDEVELHVEHGEFVCLVGRSGSGKSTLLNVISGIDTADSGAVLIDGDPLGGLDDHARTLFRRRHLGFVFQSFNLVPTLSVAQNLALPQELNGRVDPQITAQWLQRVGLDGRQHSFADELSGGEQQRVAVARALVHGPRLVLADEPTGNLDEETGEQVLDLLESLCRDTGVTLVVASHSSAVADRADRVIELAHGKLRDLSHA